MRHWALKASCHVVSSHTAHSTTSRWSCVYGVVNPRVGGVVKHVINDVLVHRVYEVTTMRNGGGFDR